MKVAVVSYSFTGNNDALAKSIAKKYSAEHIMIAETKKRTNGTIFGDTILGRSPKTDPIPQDLEKYDLVLFFAPIWLGRIASPLRPYLKYLKSISKRYAFFSISGGALGPNPKVASELKKRTGAAPVAFADMHIADLISPGKKTTMDQTSDYKINDSDIDKLTGIITQALQGCVSIA
jgi:hypothetical protein